MKTMINTILKTLAFIILIAACIYFNYWIDCNFIHECKI